VTLEDFIIYYDIAYNGTPDEKILLSFMMLDRKGQQRIDMEAYKFFWQQQIYMYG